MTDKNKLQDQKNLLKNRVFYGSFYQNGQKYVPEVKASVDQYSSYQKDIKSEWSRKQGNEFTMKGREALLYKKTNIY